LSRRPATAARRPGSIQPPTPTPSASPPVRRATTFTTGRIAAWMGPGCGARLQHRARSRSWVWGFLRDVFGDPHRLRDRRTRALARSGPRVQPLQPIRSPTFRRRSWCSSALSNRSCPSEGLFQRFLAVGSTIHLLVRGRKSRGTKAAFSNVSEVVDRGAVVASARAAAAPTSGEGSGSASGPPPSGGAGGGTEPPPPSPLDALRPRSRRPWQRSGYGRRGRPYESLAALRLSRRGSSHVPWPPTSRRGCEGDRGKRGRGRLARGSPEGV
jgi:hypothetical protein